MASGFGVDLLEEEEEVVSFNPKLIERLLKEHWKANTKRADALTLSTEFLRCFVVEAVQRAAKLAEAEGSATIQPVHIERILPQLLLDF